jgi:N-acetylmuramoyl-L-alanine amidase
VVERDGSVTQLVAFDRVAWHAGQSSWRGRSGCDAFTVGIEIVNPGKLTGTSKNAIAWFGENFGPEFGIVRAKTPEHGDGFWMPYTEDQLRTVEQLIGALARTPRCLSGPQGRHHPADGLAAHARRSGRRR